MPQITTIKKPQHLSASQITAALNSYAGSMVIPRMYEKYVTTVGQWTTAEEWASLAGAASILLSKEGINGLRRQMQDDKERLDRISKINAGRIGSASDQQERLLKVAHVS